MRVWYLIFVIGLYVPSALSQPTTNLAQHDAEAKQVVLQNPYMQVMLSYQDAIQLQSITYSNQPFLRVPKDGVASDFPAG